MQVLLCCKSSTCTWVAVSIPGGPALSLCKLSPWAGESSRARDLLLQLSSMSSLLTSLLKLLGLRLALGSQAALGLHHGCQLALHLHLGSCCLLLPHLLRLQTAHGQQFGLQPLVYCSSLLQPCTWQPKRYQPQGQPSTASAALLNAVHSFKAHDYCTCSQLMLAGTPQPSGTLTTQSRGGTHLS